MDLLILITLVALIVLLLKVLEELVKVDVRDLVWFAHTLVYTLAHASTETIWVMKLMIVFVLKVAVATLLAHLHPAQNQVPSLERPRRLLRKISRRKRSLRPKRRKKNGSLRRKENKLLSLKIKRRGNKRNSNVKTKRRYKISTQN